MYTYVTEYHFIILKICSYTKHVEKYSNKMYYKFCLKATDYLNRSSSK